MIHVVVALTAEARPLVTHFQLEPMPELEPLKAFRGADLTLVVSGVGKEPAAQAVDQLANSHTAERPAVWLNIGVAGHRQLDIGTVVVARTVTDAESGKVQQLEPPDDLHLTLGDVRTVAHVETRYESEALYEMEASAFCQRAALCTPPELIQVVKIVSDNLRSGSLCVSARQVQGLMEDSFPRIDRLISSLHRRARRLGR